MSWSRLWVFCVMDSWPTGGEPSMQGAQWGPTRGQTQVWALQNSGRLETKVCGATANSQALTLAKAPASCSQSFESLISEGCQ
jgi:hypothetical protein